jgi:aryl-alcohol dehydrogenase-like predicted oxidoreductase
MLMRSLGPNAGEVSAIGYGGMHLSVAERPDEAQALEVLLAVFDAGVTLVDTADVYCLDHADLGHNERLIAKALKRWSGAPSRIRVATKGGLVRPDGRWDRDARPEQLKQACERSLKNLGVDTIDLYQLHAPDPKVPFADSVGALADLQTEGKIRHIGLSNVTVDEINQARRSASIASVQNRLNPFFREAVDGGVLAHCTRMGIGFLAYSPTGGGRLTRKLPDIPVLADLSAELGVTPHQLVLAWVMAQGPTVIPIPSARRVAHALDSARAADLVLAATDLARITAAEFSRV